MRLAGALALLLALAGPAWSQAPATPAQTQAPAPPPLPAPAPPTTPFLRISADFHTQVVNRIATDAGQAILASVSDDKTLRVWQADTGEALATLRVPIAEGDEGALYAVAIAPDGKTLLVGGSTALAWDGAFAIYLFDLQTQKMRGRLANLPAPINHLAYAPDGRSFAVALGGDQGVRLFDATTGRLIRADREGVQGRTTWVGFDRRGRFATAGFDGAVTLYGADGTRLARRVPTAGGRPYSVAFSPNGEQLAVGFADQPLVQVLSGKDLSTVSSLRATGPGGLGAVAWAADGRLFAAGSVRNADGMAVVRSWPNGGGAGGKGVATDWLAGRDTVFQLEPAAGGGVFVAAADPLLLRLGPSGEAVFRKTGPGLDFRDLGDQRMVLSNDGLVVELRTRAMRAAWRVDMGARSITELEGTRALTPVAAPPASAVPAAALTVSDWRNNATPKLDGQALKLEPDELSRSFGVTPDQQYAAIGTDYQLKLFHRDGRLAGSAALPAPAWAIRVAGDGRSLVVAVGDGTLRWFGLEDGVPVPRVALFLAADGQRWVAWTPEGLFDHADRGGKELVGLTLNRARGQAPDWYSFAQVYRLFYNPDAVARRLRGQTEPPGLDSGTIAAELRGLQGTAAPPEIDLLEVCWTAAGLDGCNALEPSGVARGLRRGVTAAKPSLDGNPDIALPAEATSVSLRYRLKRTGPESGPVDIFVNGRNAGRTTPQTGGEAILATTIPVDLGTNRIQLRAYNAGLAAYAQSRPLQVTRPGAPAVQGAKADAVDPAKPRLFVLAVGVDAYLPGINKLNFAVADARSVAAQVRTHMPASYGGIEVIELYDADATLERVNAAMARLAAQARSEDTVLIYLSGHGITIDSSYYFVTQNAASVEAIPTSALSAVKLVEAMSRIRARNGMLFLDTCYASAFSLDSVSQLAHESGRYVLAASASLEEALDSYDDRNGVFATAVLRGLAGGAAAGGQDAVSNFDLGLFVTPLVRKLALERHHSQTARFKIAAEDARAFPIVAVPAR